MAAEITVARERVEASRSRTQGRSNEAQLRKISDELNKKYPLARLAQSGMTTGGMQQAQAELQLAGYMREMNEQIARARRGQRR